VRRRIIGNSRPRFATAHGTPETELPRQASDGTARLLDIQSAQLLLDLSNPVQQAQSSWRTRDVVAQRDVALNSPSHREGST